MSIELKFIEQNVNLKEKSYYRMGGIARYFALPRNFLEVSHAIDFAKNKNLPIAILGLGSNCVFSDEVFEGVVIALTNLNKWRWETDEILFAEAGVSNTEITEICLAAGRDGASWMYRMPGQTGASVRMNARCYGGEMSQIVTEILTIDTNGNLNCFDAKKILLGYKNTLLMNKPEIVVGVRFYFPNTKSQKDILEHMHFCENDRNKKQHFLYPSCGSTFKNNYEYGKPSGQIFDELGLKGCKRGDAEVSLYHGNFIWNKNAAKTQDMLNLASFMRKQAHEKLAVELNLEVQPIGIFDSTLFNDCGMQNLGPYVQEGDKCFTGLFFIPNSSSYSTSNTPYYNATDRSLPLQNVKRIFSSFFMNYFPEKVKNIPSVHVEVWQLQNLNDAQKNSNAPFLRWTTLCDENFNDIFDLIPKTDEDCKNLWKFSVSEIFLAHPHTQQYLECEMTPYGHFIKLQFDTIRQQRKGAAYVAKHGLKSEFIAIKNADNKYEFSFEFSFNDVKNLIEDHTIALQCALSLGSHQYFLAPYWPDISANEHADFHQPAKFFSLKLFNGADYSKQLE